ncbi:MAG: hypothetical protein QOG59_285, partial [Solirubrobacteraceae bacterium]|nr:hypothetical protein [Solirubrobacteraceae bacterium]
MGEVSVRTVSLTNWGGNYTYRAHAVHRPRTVQALRELVRGAEQVRVMGTRHAFT